MVLGRPTRENNITIDSKEIGCECVNGIRKFTVGFSISVHVNTLCNFTFHNWLEIS
jgi:hypothetical protein